MIGREISIESSSLYPSLFPLTSGQACSVRSQDWKNGIVESWSWFTKSFYTQKAMAKSWSLWLQSCFINVFFIWREVPFIQEVSDAYTSPFSETVELKMVLQARKVFWGFREMGPIRADEGLALETSAFESLYGDQFTLSTQLIKPNYLVILPPT